MNSKVIIGIVVAVIVVAGLFFFMQKQKPMSRESSQQSQTEVEANTVIIKNFSFSPDVLTVKQGTKVTWINQDLMVHKVNSDTFNSSDLNQGDKFEFVFNKVGSFDYVCSIHPAMTGKIVVE